MYNQGILSKNQKNFLLKLNKSLYKSIEYYLINGKNIEVRENDR